MGASWQSAWHTANRARVTLYQALLKADKFEWVLQKGTEIGIAAFAPIITERCVRDAVSAAKLERWRRIVREAAEQSERGIIPSLREPLPFAEAVQCLGELSLIAYEDEQTQSLRAALQQYHDSQQIALFVGPEGGFSADEIALAQRQHITPVTLCPRILRAETAVLYELGDMESPLSWRERGRG